MNDFRYGFAVVAITVVAVVVGGVLDNRPRIDPESCITVCNARVAHYTPYTCRCKR